MLDNGAQGIVIPHVNSVEEAERAVSYCKYPPIGHRSVAGAQPQFRFQNVPLADATRIVNAETLVIVMLETPEAIEQADAIAAVPGVDVVIDRHQRSVRGNGHPGPVRRRARRRRLYKVIAACRKHKVHPGMGGVYDQKLMEKYIGMGMRFISERQRHRLFDGRRAGALGVFARPQILISPLGCGDEGTASIANDAVRASPHPCF